MKMLKNQNMEFNMVGASKTQKKKKQPQDTIRGTDLEQSLMFRSFSSLNEGLDDIDSQFDQKKMFMQWQKMMLKKQMQKQLVMLNAESDFSDLYDDEEENPTQPNGIQQSE